MSDEINFYTKNEAATARLAEACGRHLTNDSVIWLSGDLGSGKTSFARALIQAVSAQDIIVPSPSFTLMQHYEATPAGGAGGIIHADLYRLRDPQEIIELGLIEAHGENALIIEWAEKARDILPAPTLHIEFSHDGDAHDGGGRHIKLRGDTLGESLSDALVRADALNRFLDAAFAKNNLPLEHLTRMRIAGDASGRCYERLDTESGDTLIVMDWHPALGTHTQAAHLAETTSQFCRIVRWLLAHDIVAPTIFAVDEVAGFMLMQDFGTLAMDSMVREGHSACDIFYFEACETLIYLHGEKIDDAAQVPRYDEKTLQRELSLFLDFYAPPLSDAARVKWDSIWQDLYARLTLPSVMVLRDFHSPNLFWLPSAQARYRVGLIDVQDALLGSPAYDLVSFLQDARVDVPKARHDFCLEHYLAHAGPHNMDEAGWRAQCLTEYAILGTQRNLKILGIFTRLANEDGHDSYLAHMPRIIAYVKVNLDHPALVALRGWFIDYLEEIWTQWSLPPA